ncbi:MAG: hypothetical protein ACJAW3_000809 [Lentimonas sp.]|jgi:hypothetical protein
MTDSIYEIFAKKIQHNDEELKAVEEVTNIVYPVIENLNKKEIINPVILKVELQDLDPKYRDPVYGLYRIAVDGGPDGSYIMLDPEKVKFILDDIVLENKLKQHKYGWYIIGLTKKVIESFEALIMAEISALSNLINDSIISKLINTPNTKTSPGKGNLKVSPLKTEEKVKTP